MFCSPFHTEAQKSISKRIFILQAGLPDVLLWQVEGQLECKETFKKAKLSPVSKVCNREFICFTHVIQLMVCLTAIQQKSGLHKDVPDRAGTGKGVSTPHSTMEGSKLQAWVGNNFLDQATQVLLTFCKFQKR